MIQKIVLILSMFLTMLLYQNCGGNFATIKEDQSLLASGSHGLSDGMDTGARHINPLINCKISSKERPNVYQNISTFGDTFSHLKFNASDTLSVDCSESKAMEKNVPLQFEISKSYVANNPNFEFLRESSLAQMGKTPGMYYMAFRVKDLDGRESLKAFYLVVECDTSTNYPKVDPTGIKVEESDVVGLFHFTVDSSKVSGGTDFEYAWDFNGDHVLDPKVYGKDLWVKDPNVQNVYVNAVNQRKIRLKVRNSCFKEVEVEVDRNLISKHPIQRTESSLAEALDYQYLQADIRSNDLDDNTAEQKRKNVDYLATDNPGYTSFSCSYNFSNNKASLNISTAKKYQSSSNTTGSLSLSVRDIPDTEVDGVQSIPYGTARVSSSEFRVAAAEDAMNQERYTKDSDCKVKLRIERQSTDIACSNGAPSVKSYQVNVLGEYSCANMKTSAGSNVSLNNGKFFCTDSYSERCKIIRPAPTPRPTPSPSPSPSPSPPSNGGGNGGASPSPPKPSPAPAPRPTPTPRPRPPAY